MRTNALAVVVFAALTVLAGCTGGTVGTGPATSGDGPRADGPAVDAARDTDGGAVNFWISDERNDIDDFEHLNVTVTKVAFHRVGDAPAGGNDSDGSDAPNGSDAANGTGQAPDGDGDEADGGGGGEWIERDVADRTVDLTRLQGENATLIGAFDLPNGSYDQVFVTVGGINNTLADGGSTNVKLPSGRLKLNQGFTVTANESPDFVFDITVVKAGKSGKYILKPVVSESGTDVPIRDADDRGQGPPEDRGPPENRGDGPPGDRGNGNGNGPPGDAGPPDDPGNGSEDAAATADLEARFVGNVTPGSNATVAVTRGGDPVAGATVTVNDGRVGTTGEDGRITFEVPDAGTLTVVVTDGESEAELEVEFEEGDRRLAAELPGR